MPAKRAKPGMLLGVGLDEAARAVRAARSSVQIATPFLSAEVAALLARASEESGARRRRLITALNAPAVQGGYLDPDGLREFLDAGFEITSLRNLHVKVILVDDSWGLVGSGNLTRAGMNGGNAELGVVLDAKQSRLASRSHFRAWWDSSRPLDLDYLKVLERRAKKGPVSRTHRQREGRGGLFRSEAGVELPAFAARRHGSGYWLKIMYGTDDKTPVSHWRGRRWVSDRHLVRADGTIVWRPTYKVGDHLVVYLSTGRRQACPAVLRVTAEPVFDPSRVRRETSKEDSEKWAWVTEVECVAAKRLDRAPVLSAIGVRPTSVRQHGHIALTRAQYRKAFRAIRG